MEVISNANNIPNIPNTVNPNFKIERNKIQDNKKYDIVFVGGGPSTLSFLSYLFQRRLAEKIFTTCNILVIEKSDFFGSGCLGKYGINTNTAASGFVKLICHNNKQALQTMQTMQANNDPNTKTNEELKELKEKPEIDNEEQVEFEDGDNEEKENEVEQKKIVYKPINGFCDILNSNPAQTLIKLGNKCGPLTLVGYFLDCVGNFISEFINKKFNKEILMNKTEVKSIKMLKKDEIILNVTRNENENISIKTKYLVMATGGKPRIPKNIDKILITMKDPNDFYFSNNILQEFGYRDLIEKLKGKSNIKRKIVIIGGSHSGFSSAWILLNGASEYTLSNNYGNYKPGMRKECEECKRYPFNEGKELEQKECICYGRVSNKKWGYTSNLNNIVEDVNNINKKENNECETNDLQDSSIEIYILYRDQIRVFYTNEESAKSDNYNKYSKTDMNRKGNIFPFIGLRADAKKLYQDIIKGKEKRIKLIKTKTFNDQLKFISDCDAVIWACGYETERIKILDSKNNPLDFCTSAEEEMYEVDYGVRLINKIRVPYKNIFGIGQGYSTFAPEVINGKKARGDSINLYNTSTSKKLYSSLEFFFSQKFKDYRDYREGREIREIRETREAREINVKDIKELRDFRDIKEVKEVREPKEVKEIKIKEFKEVRNNLKPNHPNHFLTIKFPKLPMINLINTRKEIKQVKDKEKREEVTKKRIDIGTVMKNYMSNKAVISLNKQSDININPIIQLFDK